MVGLSPLLVGKFQCGDSDVRKHASEYVVNFNIALDTQDLSACKRIATAIRATSTGGQEGTSSPMRTPALHAASRVF